VGVVANVRSPRPSSIELDQMKGGVTDVRLRKANRKAKVNEKDVRRDCRGGFGEMIGAVLFVLLAVGMSICVFVVVWWLLGKL
jgi:hypothetical protein